MKFVIDIPEELTEKDHFYTEKEKWSIVDAVQNSIPLDKLKERINLEKLGYPPSAGYYRAIMKVLQIIDNRNEVSK